MTGNDAIPETNATVEEILKTEEVDLGSVTDPYETTSKPKEVQEPEKDPPHSTSKPKEVQEQENDPPYSTSKPKEVQEQEKDRPHFSRLVQFSVKNEKIDLPGETHSTGNIEYETKSLLYKLSAY